MNCVVWHVQMSSAVYCSSRCRADDNICLAFVYNSPDQECFTCSNAETGDVEFGSIPLQGTRAYKIFGKLFMY